VGEEDSSMKTGLSLVISLLLLAGCAGRVWTPQRGQDELQFWRDANACRSGSIIAPLIVLPLIAIVQSEVQRQCMEDRGYAVKEPESAETPETTVHLP